EEHVKEIIEGLQQASVIIPNPIIAYMLPGAFEFAGSPGSKSPTEIGEGKILVPIDGDKQVGFVIDGQHRVAAMRKMSLEAGEEDLTVGVVLFLAPDDAVQRAEFEEFVLEQMSIINSAKPLSDNESLLVQQRIEKVFAATGATALNTANLIVMDL